MSLDKWRDVAELVALVAVVGSLVLVVIELRQTQAALNLSKEHIRTLARNSFLASFLSDEEKAVQLARIDGLSDSSE